jgi:hypothetical protein
MTTKTKRICTVAFCALWAALFVIVPLAWFAGRWSSGSSSVDFTTSGNAALGDMTYWMYASPFEVTGTGTDTPRWIKYDASKANNNLGFIIAPYQQNDDPEADQFVLSSLHFGKIDNLTSLNSDNKFYFCVKLNSEVHGSQKISFDFDYANYGTDQNDPRYSVQIFDMDKQPINHFTGQGLEYNSAKPELMELLEFTYCVTTTPPPSAASVAGVDPFGGALTFSAEPTAIMHSLENAETGLAADVTDYYLYVCISPKLENFALHEHILEFFAQSYMLFDLSFSFEVHD